MIKNQIFEAIQKGICNVLNLDDESSINYRHTEIGSDIMPQIVNNAFTDLLNDKIVDDFEDIIYMMKEHNYRYKVLNINDLYILKTNILKSGYVFDSPTDLLDTSDIFSYILKSGNIIPIHEKHNKLDIAFLAVHANTIYARNQRNIHAPIDILIPADWKKYNKEMKWICFLNDSKYFPYADYTDYMLPSENKRLQHNAIKNFNGYKNCEELIKKQKDEDTFDFPALKYSCSQYKKIGNTEYVGYVPSYGQLNFLLNNYNIINQFTDNFITGFFDHDLWTSNYGFRGNGYHDGNKMYIISALSNLINKNSLETTSMAYAPVFFLPDKPRLYVFGKNKRG